MLPRGAQKGVREGFMKTLIFLSGLLILASSCGTAPTTPTNYDFTGTYSGTETGTLAGTTAISQTVEFILTQTGQTVTGSYTTGNGGTATIFGTSLGDTITSFAITSSSGCTGTLSGTVSKTTTGLSGSVTGTSSCGLITLNFTLTK